MCVGIVNVFFLRFLCLQMVLRNGDVKTFEVSVEQFNQLRYSVAKVHIHKLYTSSYVVVSNLFSTGPGSS
jgi:hypothetical protein